MSARLREKRGRLCPRPNERPFIQSLIIDSRPALFIQRSERGGVHITFTGPPKLHPAIREQMSERSQMSSDSLLFTERLTPKKSLMLQDVFLP
jgi:hypothetical protein